MVRLALFVCVGIIAITPGVSARTWYISPDGTGDAPTIQAAIDSSAAGDTVSLANGVYTGIGNRNIRYHGKSLTVNSAGGDPDLCTIDCLLAARGFIFDPGDGPGAILEGITLRRGWAPEPFPPADSGGGGIWCDGASPTIRNVKVIDCETGLYGGGMWCSGGSAPVLTNVLFEDNYAGAGAGVYSQDSYPVLTDVTFFSNYGGSNGTGGGMYCEGGSPRLASVRFIDNLGDWGTGGLALRHDCQAVLTSVDFVGNVGLNAGAGGLECWSSSPLILDCTFSENMGWWAGGIFLTGSSAPEIIGCTLDGNIGYVAGGLTCLEESSPSLERTIITGSTSGVAIYCQTPGTCTADLTCCDIYGNELGDWVGRIADQYGANGNFSADPKFCDAANGDFTLEDCSPCLPGNHPDGHECGGIIGAFGSGCDCESAVEQKTWGAIKAVYR